ncbi:MAG: VOC family protein [Chitinophagaceae bacterium]|jgi:catechol 2,3-dioxygenase-like lactoylglutathione lyase family enzyme
MSQQLAHISIVVRDYDEAIQYYTNVLGFTLIEDTVISDVKRWVIVEPNGSMGGCQLLLAKAATPEQEKHIGNQTGGRVFLFLFTDNFERDYTLYISKGVEFTIAPHAEEYGMVAVFKDIYGNLWDLIQPHKK